MLGGPKPTAKSRLCATGPPRTPGGYPNPENIQTRCADTVVSSHSVPHKRGRICGRNAPVGRKGVVQAAGRAGRRRDSPNMRRRDKLIWTRTG